MNAVVSTIVAHQGGWDEALLIGGPMAAIAGLLYVAKKRVDAAADERESRESEQV